MAGAQLVGLARGAAREPLCALAAAGGPAEREQAPRGSLPLGGGELLAALIVGELLDG
jgi:hypothetical protein